MILLSTSKSVCKAFNVAPIENTVPVATSEWYRFWRVDAKKFIGFGEVMLFTNHETLYTFVADSGTFKRGSDFVMFFYFDMERSLMGTSATKGELKKT